MLPLKPLAVTLAPLLARSLELSPRKRRMMKKMSSRTVPVAERARTSGGGDDVSLAHLLVRWQTCMSWIASTPGLHQDLYRHGQDAGVVDVSEESPSVEVDGIRRTHKPPRHLSSSIPELAFRDTLV
jgi:hypothetical protein